MENTSTNNFLNKDQSQPKRKIPGWDEKQLELLYSFGYQTFQSGKYDEALKYFLFLYRLDPDSYRYVYSIAACYQRMKDYKKAFDYYVECLELAPNQPEAYFYLSDCLEQNGEKVKATEMLKKTITLSKNHSKYKKLEEKAKLELKRLLKQLNNKE